MRTTIAFAAAVSLLACAPRQQGPRKDRPMVTRIGPNGYVLEEEKDNVKNGKRRRECSVVEITGSHVPTMVCSYPDEDADNRRALQNDLDMPRNCRSLQCIGN
jgi:hypothetical protein